jgi:hypothetical protein
MPHHFTKSTIQADVWCTKCHKITPHRVFDGRRGPCLDCLARLESEIKNRPVIVAPAQQGRLF